MDDCGFDFHSWELKRKENKAQLWVPLINMQCLENAVKSGERSVLLWFPLPTVLDVGYGVKKKNQMEFQPATFTVHVIQSNRPNWMESPYFYSTIF